MSAKCDAEMCQHWTGHGCACEVFDIERPPRVCIECDTEIGEREFWSLTPSGAVHLGCPDKEIEPACEVCGSPFETATTAERCLDCEGEQ